MERTIPKLIGKEEWPSLEENMRVGAIFEARCDVEALAYAYAEREKMLLKVRIHPVSMPPPLST